jgi:glycosyltransferase involved in cell wall biosynthesis
MTENTLPDNTPSFDLATGNREDLSGKSIYIISNFPPEKCGVAVYADMQRKWFTERGAGVKTATMQSKAAADLHFDFYSFQGLFRWLWFCATTPFDKVYVHFSEIYFFPSPRKKSYFHYFFRFIQAAGLKVLGRRAGPGGHLVVHEIMTGSSVSLPWRVLRNFAFTFYHQIEIHTETSRKNFLDTYTHIRRAQTVVVSGARYFVKHFHGNQEEARAKLELPSKAPIFVCLGFITPIKGTDLAIQAFGLVKAKQNASLYIVGSIEGLDSQYIEKLKLIGANTPGTHFYFDFLSEEMFDCWLQAADVVILPYRGVFSSGVGARASVYAKPLIISDLPSLKENFPRATVFRDEEHLAEILQQFACDQNHSD